MSLQVIFSIKIRVYIVAFFMILFMGCHPEKRREVVKLNQYMVEGMTLYRGHCANCHQEDGTGLARLIPPLANSDYLKKMSNAFLACQVRYGLEDTIYVNNVMYHQKMPGFDRLTPIEIAEIVTYVNNTWGIESGIYEVKKAEIDLQKCSRID